jgi:hypothetical protein
VFPARTGGDFGGKRGRGVGIEELKVGVEYDLPAPMRRDAPWEYNDTENFFRTYERQEVTFEYEKSFCCFPAVLQYQPFWLYWNPGYITEVECRGNDVMSGPFSGCYFVKYKKNDNQIYVGHIGTDNVILDNTRRVKTAWNGFARDENVELLCGFNPATQLNLECFQKKLKLKLRQGIGKYGRYAYAVITGSYACYCVPVLKSNDTIVFLEKTLITSLTATELKNIFPDG